MIGSKREIIVRATGALLLASLLLGSGRISAYSVLTHEQIIDFLWERDIRRILLERYPGTTPDDLRKAHAYAYGGSLIQDMGYYPSGNKFFSDLVHYVRTGDFVCEMIRDARDVNELAFALGALAHYTSDETGHPFVNEAVSLSFPKLRKKYGKEVTYAEDPKAHIRTEFGFDVLEIAQQHYASQSFHDFIGFEVARPLLDRAFLKIYGIELQVLMHDEDRSIMDYRHALSYWIPRLTEVALITKKKELAATPNFNPRKFRYILRRSEFEREWGTNYDKPGFFARFLAVVVRILPKVGALKTLDVKVPDAQTEKIFVTSVERTVAAYHDLLITVGDPAPAALAQPPFRLADVDLDTGRPAAPAEYFLTDKTYARLLKLLNQDGYRRTSAALRANILGFYGDLARPLETKRHKNAWKELQQELDELRQQPAPPVQGNR
jgi:Zinc dependent phospholipase C